MKEEYFLLGRWQSPLLHQSFFVNYYQPETFSELNLPPISGKYCQLYHEGYYPMKDRKILSRFFFEKMESKDFNYLNEFTRKAENTAKVFSETPYELNSDSSFKKLVENAKAMFCCWIVVHQADPGIEAALKRKCESQGIELSAALSQTKQNGLELFEKEKEMAKLSRLYRKKELTERELDSFTQKYGWTSTHAFMGKPLTRKTLIGQLEKFEEPSQAKAEKHEIRFEELKIAAKFSWLRLHFIETFNKTTYKFWPYLSGLAKEHGLSFEEVTYHSYKELTESNFKTKNEAQERIKGFGIFVENGSEEILVGERLVKESAKYRPLTWQFNEVKGFVASSGNAMGIAKVISSMKELSKVNKGDILITTETTPDYVMAMRKAAAIITDQGGITSHAGIVSREFGIPCIVGTKIATKIFKDGDLLEVDANKGIVRKQQKKSDLK